MALSPLRAAPLAAFAFAVTMLSTTLPTPLYPIYEQQFGFHSLVVTAVYATYAVGVIAALLTYGHVSDVIGRRPVLFAALGFAAASAVVFLLAEGTLALFPGRILSGLSAGLFTGTGTAFIADLYGERKTEAALLATACNIGGLGLGPIIAAIAADLGNDPLRVPFWVDLALILIASVAMLLTPEIIKRTGRARPRLQRLQVPEDIRDVFLAASVGGFAGFAILGLFTATAPGFMAEVLGVTSRIAVGCLVGSMFISSAAAQVIFHRVSPARGLRRGLVVLIAGLALIIVALATAEIVPLVAGAVTAGVGHGLTFKGGMTSIATRLEPANRAAVISTFFVVLYTALSLPVVGVGLLAELTDLRDAAITLAALAAVLCLISLLRLRSLQRRPAAA
jgi:MFS family permease